MELGQNSKFEMRLAIALSETSILAMRVILTVTLKYWLGLFMTFGLRNT
jgi:hypothetical protein